MAQFPTDWSIVEKHPNFSRLSPRQQREWRDAWIEEMLERRGQLKPEDKEKARMEYEAMAYATVPKEQWPSELQRPIRQRTPTEAFFSITPREVLSHVWHGGTRALGTPQQTIANIIMSPSRREGFFAPFIRSGKYLIGEGEETELPGGMVTQIATDPLMWASLGTGGLALLLRGKSIPELISLAQRYPRLAPTIEWYMRQISRGAFGHPASKIAGPAGLEAVGVVKLTPEQEKIISTITKNPLFKKHFRSPKELEAFAETYARSTPQKRKQLLQALGDPFKKVDLKSELKELPSRRETYTYPPHIQSPPPSSPPKGKGKGGKKPPTESKTAVEDLSSPSQYSKKLDEFLGE